MLLVWVLLGCLGLLLALLAVPVELAFTVRYGEDRQAASGRMVWLFGLVRVDLGRAGTTAASAPQPTKAGKARSRPWLNRRLLATLRREQVARRLLRLAGALLRRIRIRELRLDMRLGLGDPADTGRLWAVVGPLAALLSRWPLARVAIAPDFLAEACEVDGAGRIRLVPLQLLLVLLGGLLSPGSLRTLRAIRAAA